MKNIINSNNSNLIIRETDGIDIGYFNNEPFIKIYDLRKFVNLKINSTNHLTNHIRKGNYFMSNEWQWSPTSRNNKDGFYVTNETGAIEIISKLRDLSNSEKEEAILKVIDLFKKADKKSNPKKDYVITVQTGVDCKKQRIRVKSQTPQSAILKLLNLGYISFSDQEQGMISYEVDSDITVLEDIDGI